MIEYVNSFLLFTLLGIVYYICYKYKIFLRAINIVMDSVILDQLNSLQHVEKDIDSEVKFDHEDHFWRPGFLHIIIWVFLGYNVSNFVKKLDVTDV